MESELLFKIYKICFICLVIVIVPTIICIIIGILGLVKKGGKKYYAIYTIVVGFIVLVAVSYIRKS